MNFSLPHTIEILERTPRVLRSYLEGLSDEWIRTNEGPETWSPYDIVGHLIFGEKTDWMVRVMIILEADDKRFEPFDRFAQFSEDQSRPLANMLQEFETLRVQNLDALRSLQLTEEDFNQTGVHPAFGEVTLGELIATWAVHDLAHLAQISRVMAKQYKKQVGPWKEYIGILNS